MKGDPKLRRSAMWFPSPAMEKLNASLYYSQDLRVSRAWAESITCWYSSTTKHGRRGSGFHIRRAKRRKLNGALRSILLLRWCEDWSYSDGRGSRVRRKISATAERARHRTRAHAPRDSSLHRSGGEGVGSFLEDWLCWKAYQKVVHRNCRWKRRAWRAIWET